MLRGRRLRRVALVLIATILSAAAAEWGVGRFVLPGYWRPVPPFGASENPEVQGWLSWKRSLAGGPSQSTRLTEFDVELGWRNCRGACVADGKVSTHVEGWRGAQRDYSPRPPPGRLRAAAFGESFTFGFEVADHACWAARVEDIDPHYEVLNFGVNAYGTDQALLLAERELPRLHADLVLAGLMLENIGRNVNRYRPLWFPAQATPMAKPRFVLERDRLHLVPLPFRDEVDLVDAVADGSVLERLREHEAWSSEELPALLRWSSVARLFAARRADAHRSVLDLWTKPGEAFDVTLALVDRFRELARAQGARDAVLLVFPSRTDLDRMGREGHPYWTGLIGALQSRAAPFIDFSQALAARARTDGVNALFEDRGHYSPLGNDVVAHVLVEWLRAHAPADVAAPRAAESAPGR